MARGITIPDKDWPSVLNIGCADDPLFFGDGAVHFDIDDWSYKHKHFVQGDAHELTFDDKMFDTVIAGDILEHALDPEKIIREACRVCSRHLVLTVFEEWKLPGPGQWIKEGAENSEIESQALGYEGREDYQNKVYPKRIGVSDDEIPHLIHINQFTDEDMLDMNTMIRALGFRVREFSKVREAFHEPSERPFYNWLGAYERIERGAE